MNFLEEMLGEHRRSLTSLATGKVKLFETDSSGRIVDGSADYVEKLQKWIAEIERLLEARRNA